MSLSSRDAPSFTLDAHHERLLSASQAYITANRALVGALDHALGHAGAERSFFEHGGTAGRLLASLPAVELRSTLDAAIAREGQTRRECRLAFFALAHAEGVSISEIARRWGVSRQYVSKVLGDTDP